MTEKSKRGKLVIATYQRLLNTVTKWTCNYDVTQDIVQETYKTVFECPEFDPNRPDAFGFLRQKAYWLWKSHCRRQPINRLPDDFPDPLADRKLEMVEMQEVIHLAVTELPETTRDVVSRYLAGMPHAEIATDMGLPITKVYGLFHQAKANLRQILEPPEFASRQ